MKDKLYKSADIIPVRMIHKFIALPFIFFLAFSISAPAQIGVTINFAPITEDFCRMKGCTVKDTILPLRTPDLWKTADIALAEESSSPHPSFSLRRDPATERDISFRFFNHIAQTTDGENSVLVKQLDKTKYFSARNDSFRNEDKGLGTKLLHATILTQTIQTTNLMSMIAFPDVNHYSCRSWAEAKGNLHRAWTNSPVWDKDPWVTNFVGHPYAGSFYYNMLRSQGASPRTSFLYSTGQSLLWEYVVEAVAEQPSIQDLLFTSNLGSIIGELSHRATIRIGRNGFSTFEKILTTFINPAYVLNNGYKKHHRTPSLPF
jgi:hypothetical protein